MVSELEVLSGIGEDLIEAVEEELGPKCSMSSCDRDSVAVKNRFYCSKHFFAEQMIDRKIKKGEASE